MCEHGLQPNFREQSRDELRQAFRDSIVLKRPLPNNGRNQAGLTPLRRVTQWRRNRAWSWTRECAISFGLMTLHRPDLGHLLADRLA